MRALSAARASALCLALATLALAARGARGSGFEVRQGGPSIGNAGAGANATADDPSTAWFNPAGMSYLVKDEYAAYVDLVDISVRFRNRGSTDSSGAPLSGGNGLDAGGGAVIPNLYAVLKLDDDWRLGFSVNSPFGLGADYGDHWAGRYYTTRASLHTVDLGIEASRSLSKSLSIGAGIDIQQAEAKLDSAVDFGTIAATTFGTGPAAALGLTPQGNDGGVKLRADSLGVGMRAGLLFRPDEATSVGLSYRSSVFQKLEGDAEFTVPKKAAILTAGGAFQDSGVTARTRLPEAFSLGAARRVAPKWTLVGQIDWTRWSRFQELRIQFDNPNQPDSVDNENWHDATRYSLGAIFRPTDTWTLRAGVAYDQSPVLDDYRTPAIPDNDRKWVALGVEKRLGKRVTVGLEYAHEFLGDGDVRLSDPFKGSLRGSIQSSIDILNVLVTFDF